MTRFIKYQAAGNDFIVIDSTSAYESGEGAAAVAYWQERAKHLCDRHFGIGADGILLVSRVPTELSDARMDIINADGSLAEMCGNGIRCAARYLADKSGLNDGAWRIDTLGGVQWVCMRSDRDAYPIEVAMAMVQVGEPICYTAEDGRVFCGRKVDVGNPHFVIIIKDCDALKGDAALVYLHQMAEVYGDELSHAPIFEAGSNIEFVRLLPDQTAAMAVYERGCGITLACGTGATAVGAVVMQENGKMKQCQVTLEGGKLCITAPCTAHGRYRLCGDAQRVFCGEV